MNATEVIVDELNRLKAENERFRKALSFYANEHNYNDDPSDIPGCPVPGTAPIWVDHGGIAQQALKTI